MSNLIPHVGVGVGVVYPGEGFVWLYREGTSHGNGEYSFPGGRLEFKESLEDCARRETLEEIGVELDYCRYIPKITEDIFPVENQHWITHYFLGRPRLGQRPRIMEPHKCSKLIISRSLQAKISSVVPNP